MSVGILPVWKGYKSDATQSWVYNRFPTNGNTLEICSISVQYFQAMLNRHFGILCFVYVSIGLSFSKVPEDFENTK